MASASEVPGKYDVVINSQGYVFDRTRESTLYGSRARAEYSYTPTFIERQNVSNAYGDNAQDFFLTTRQRDWSLGEQQKFFRSGQDGKYWMGNNVDVTVPGQVSLAPTVSSLTFAAAVKAGCREGQTNKVVVTSSTKLYRVAEDATITDLGAHGLGTQPTQYGMCNDGLKVYMTSTAAGTVGVRSWDGTSFATFSASGADAIEFLNNTLYGFRKAAAGGDLVRWDSSGTLSSLFSWKGGDGTATGGTFCRLSPYGGKLLILWAYGQEAAELWIYDGVSTSRLEVFPENFTASDMEVLYGVVYIAGSYAKTKDASNSFAKPAVLFFDGSQIGKLWEANDFNTTAFANSTYVIAGPHPSLGISGGRLIFTDEASGNLMAYNPALGGVSSIGTYTASSGDTTRVISTGFIQVHTRNQTAGYFFPAATYPTSGYIITSLIDFESSLSKIFRGVTVEFNAAADGNGGTVDLSYQLDSLTGSWTSLATGVTSGTEVAFPANTAGHSVSIKIALNKGTSTAGPVLKSMNVRGAPRLTNFKMRSYNLDLTCTPANPTQLQDGSIQPLTGHEQAVNLIAAITSPTPISITDRFGTYTAILEPSQCDILEIHSDGGGGLPANSGQFIATITAREV